MSGPSYVLSLHQQRPPNDICFTLDGKPTTDCQNCYGCYDDVLDIQDKWKQARDVECPVVKCIVPEMYDGGDFIIVPPEPVIIIEPEPTCWDGKSFFEIGANPTCGENNW